MHAHTVATAILTTAFRTWLLKIHPIVLARAHTCARSLRHPCICQVHGRPSTANLVIDDVYVNETHLRLHFPDSAALDALPR